MNGKFYAFLAILAILLLSISAVSAADDATADSNLTVDSAVSEEIESDTQENEHVLQDDEWNCAEVKAEAQNILVGHDETISAKLTDENEEIINRDFNVSVYRVTEGYDEQEIYPAQTITGNGSFTVASSYFTAGTYFAKATFAGDGKYGASESRTYFFVESEKQTPVFYLANDEYYTDSNYLGLTFSIYDSRNLAIPCSVDLYVNGIYNMTLRQREPESCFDFYMEIRDRIDYEFKVVFKGDDAFNAQNYTFAMHPREKRSWISIDASTVVYGQDAVIEVELMDDDGEHLNGNFIVNILENGNDPSRLNLTCTATGSKTITIPANDLKNNASYTVTATYAGNSIYTPCTSIKEFSVLDCIRTYFDILVEHTAYMESGDVHYAIANRTKIWYELKESDTNDWITQYIDIYLNGEHVTSILTGDEQGEITIDNLKKGMNTISFVFNGTEGYSPCSKTFNITNHEKKSQLETTVPYALVGHDATATLRLTDGADTINEDFTVGLYKYNEEYLGTPLATYVMHNGTGTISIPSSLLRYGEHVLVSYFEGNDKYSPLYKFTHFFVHDEKEYIYITVNSYSYNVNTDSITLPISVRSERYSVPCLVDVYVDGKFYRTVNYTKEYLDVKIDGLKLGKNVIRFDVNESDLHQSATEEYEITYSLQNTETYIQCSKTQSSMEFGVEFYFSIHDEVYNYIYAGTADIYVNGEKYTTLNFKKDSNPIYYTYRAASPGQYNISVYYPGDEVSYGPSWSENITVTITPSEVNSSTATVLNNIDGTTQIRAGDEIKFDVTLRNSNGNAFRDYVDIYVNGSKITSLYGYERFTFAPSEVGTYSITARYEGDDVYGASSSDAILITVIEASKPAALTASVVQTAIQGDTIEIDYSVISNGEAICEGDENNYLAIYLNNDLITTTTDLTGKLTVKLNRAGYNQILIYAYSTDKKYDFNGQTYCNIGKTCYAEPNPSGRVQTSLVITADSQNLQFADTITIYNNLSNASMLNCPNELHRLLNESYNSDIGSVVPNAMLRYYLNGELIGTSHISVYGMNSKVKFTLANVNRTGWYNITAVMDDGENVLGCTSNLLSLYVNPIKTRISADSVKITYNQTHQFGIILMNDRDNKVIANQPVEVYVNGVKNETLYSGDRFNFRGLVMGKNNITLIYRGGEGYGPSNCTVVADVVKMTISLSISATQTSMYAGCATDIRLQITYSTDHFPIPVSIYVNGVKNDTVIMNKYSDTFQVIPVGYEFEVYARYEADEYRSEATSNTVTLYPRKHSTTLKISTDKQQVEIGSAVKITINCSEKTGLVDIKENEVTIGTIDLSQTNVYQYIPNKTGRFNVHAYYRETEINTYARSGTVLIISNPKSTGMNIQPDKNPIEMGSSADITVELFDSDHSITDNSVDIYVNYIKNATLNLAQGNVFRFTPENVGTYEIYAKFNGNATHSQSTSYTTTIIVNRIATGLTITSDKNTIEIGNSFTINVNLTSKGKALQKPVTLILQSGSVEVTDRYVFTPENAGTYDITAQFLGDDTYDSSASDSIRLVVNKMQTSLAIGTNSSEYDFGSPASISIDLTSGDAKLADIVEIYVNGIRVDTVDLNKADAYKFTPSKAGDYRIQAKYLGNDRYLGSESDVVNMTFKSKADNTNAPAKQTVKLTLKKVKVKRSAKKLVLTATLKINGKAEKGLKVTFKFKGKKYIAKTSKKGIAKVTIKKKVLKKLKVGKKVKYQASYGKTTVKRTVKVKR